MPDRDTVIAMARKCGLAEDAGTIGGPDGPSAFWSDGDRGIELEDLVRFAALVAAQEREADAALCDAEAWRLKAIAVRTQSRATNSRAIQASECADLIRARKEET